MKICFFDIDGTLCEFGKQPGERTMAAIHRAQQKGHKVLLCTGRTPASLPDFLKNAGFDGIVAGAGSYAELNGQVLVDEPLSQEIVARSMELLHKNQVFYTMECKAGNYMVTEFDDVLQRMDSETAEAIQSLNAGFVDSMKLQPLENYPGEPVYKFCFVAASRQQLAEVETELADVFDVVFQPAPIPHLPIVDGEMIRKDCNKGTAVRQVCKKLGIPLSDAIAFGDSQNDASMLSAVGTAVVMGNAPDSLKEMADLVAPPCTEQGVADALETLGLI